MSGAVQFSVGQALRDAREAQGITVEDAAARLRLMHRQIGAMEADDFESLGQPVFARGFVRNYARLLGLAPELLLAQMGGAPEEPPVVSRAEPPPQRSWLTSPWLILLLLGALVVMAVPVGLYLWLNSDVDEAADTHAAVQRPAPRPSPTPRPLPAPVATDVPADPPAEVPPETVPEAAPTSPQSVVEPEAAEAAPVVPAEVPVARGVLRLEFGADAWTDIRDASGRSLHRQLNPAGSEAQIEGQPPFRVVIGNAAQTRMTYNGRPIDLKPFIDVTVARFTLEE